MEGERIDTWFRTVVSPAAGAFAAAALAGPVRVGTTIGFVGETPVVSPFAGDLVVLEALEGERLAPHQRIAWLRSA